MSARSPRKLRKNDARADLAALVDETVPQLARARSVTRQNVQPVVWIGDGVRLSEFAMQIVADSLRKKFTQKHAESH